MNTMLGKVINAYQRDWEKWLPLVLAAYRSSRHEATGFSPNLLMFGRETRAPVDLVYGRPPDALRIQNTSRIIFYFIICACYNIRLQVSLRALYTCVNYFRTSFHSYSNLGIGQNTSYAIGTIGEDGWPATAVIRNRFAFGQTSL